MNTLEIEQWPELVKLWMSDFCTLLIRAWPDAYMSESVIDLCFSVDLPALELVVESYIEYENPPTINFIGAFIDKVNPDRKELLLIVENPGISGSKEWLTNVNKCGDIMQNAINKNQKLAETICSQIGFDL